MKIESVEGIVISETNYSESSKILNVLTKEHGLIGIMSKGCRSMKSKLRGVSRKLLYGTFHIYYKPNGLSTLIGVDVISSFSETLTDLERISYASYILDLTHQVLKQNEEEGIFDLLKDTLLKIEEGLNPIALTNILEVKLLDFLGVSPSIDACAHCGSDKQIVTLSSDAGGYVCKNCYNNEPLVSDKTIKMIRMYYYVDIKNITKLEVSDSVSFEINRFLEDYYERFTGLYMKSKDFIKRLNQMKEN
jgi:DNA repair protein RecO (recombination protein O)